MLSAHPASFCATLTPCASVIRVYSIRSACVISGSGKVVPVDVIDMGLPILSNFFVSFFIITRAFSYVRKIMVESVFITVQ